MSADGGREGGMPRLFICSWHTSYESNFIPTGGSEGGRDSLMGTHKLVCAWHVKKWVSVK